jgi:hypothetical protein
MASAPSEVTLALVEVISETDPLERQVHVELDWQEVGDRQDVAETASAAHRDREHGESAR